MGWAGTREGKVITLILQPTDFCDDFCQQVNKASSLARNMLEIQRKTNMDPVYILNLHSILFLLIRYKYKHLQ